VSDIVKMACDSKGAGHGIFAAANTDCDYTTRAQHVLNFRSERDPCAWLPSYTNDAPRSVTRTVRATELRALQPLKCAVCVRTQSTIGWFHNCGTCTVIAVEMLRAASHETATQSPNAASEKLPYCPVPDRYTAVGAPVLAGSLITTSAVLVPIPFGVNVTLMLQLAPGASDPTQLFVCAKSPAFVPAT
jgi:hypothetical protein